MAGASQALALLALADNYGDLTVKLSSLRQAKDILLICSQALSLLGGDPVFSQYRSSNPS